MRVYDGTRPDGFEATRATQTAVLPMPTFGSMYWDLGWDEGWYEGWDVGWDEGWDEGCVQGWVQGLKASLANLVI